MLTQKRKDQLNFLVGACYYVVVGLIVYITLKYIVGWILPFLLAFCMVSLLHPVIVRLEKRLHFSRKFVSIAVMLFIYLVAGVLLFFIILQLAFLVKDALAMLPSYYENTLAPSIVKIGQSMTSLTDNLPPNWKVEAASIQGEILSAIRGFLLSLSQRGIAIVTGLTGKIPSFVIGLTFTIMLSFFVSAGYSRVTGFINKHLPRSVVTLAINIKRAALATIVKYFKASLTLMFITFIELSVGFLVLGVKGAVAVAACVALLDALPFFGTGAAVIPWIIAELIGGNYPFALGLLVLYAIVTLVRNMIEPKVVGDKLGMDPIVSLISIYLGYQLLGVLGMIVLPIITQIILELYKNGSIDISK